MKNTISLTDKVALITGGSRAIGAAIAKTLGSAGSLISVGYHGNEEGALETITGLGDRARIAKGDVSSPKECRRIVDEVIETFGRIDILINNAAIGLRDTFDTTYEEWQSHWNDTLNANLMSAVNMTFCSVPYMRRQGGGKVINISSDLLSGGNRVYCVSCIKGCNGQLHPVHCTLTCKG